MAAATSMLPTPAKAAGFPISAVSSFSAATSKNSPAPLPTELRSALITRGPCLIILSGRTVTASATVTYVDFRDQRQTLKDSALWYARVAPATDSTGRDTPLRKDTLPGAPGSASLACPVLRPDECGGRLGWGRSNSPVNLQRFLAILVAMLLDRSRSPRSSKPV